MLFNSVEFIFLFLPGILAIYAVAGRATGPTGARITLFVASLFFYAWWEIRFLPILLISCLVNYFFGLTLASAQRARYTANRLIVFGIFLNLGSLAYFKYIGFLTVTFKDITHASLAVPSVLLPLGISFFTFHQITYLVHVYQSGEAERDPVRYGLFVGFFPQLLAGPITYAREMLPQFANQATGRLIALDMAAGLTIFAFGLVKKVVLADSLAPYADAVFGATAKGIHPTLIEAWLAVLAYAFQIYFDFSGYSDMAIGLARMFGIRLPLNFHSPYKATNIIEFWRRWHISLSRFLRDYLYIPLGGNRLGGARRLSNLMITMALGGLWHGAGWTFVIWGGLHGVYLIVNHVWRRISAGFVTGPRLGWLGGVLTFLAVCVAWVYFRSDSVTAAHTILRAMAGENGAVVSAKLMQDWPSVAWLVTLAGIQLGTPALLPDGLGLLLLLACAALAFFGPNTQQIMGWHGVAIDTYKHLDGDRSRWWHWRPTWLWGIACAIAIAASLLTFERPARFLYFQF